MKYEIVDKIGNRIVAQTDDEACFGTAWEQFQIHIPDFITAASVDHSQQYPYLFEVKNGVIYRMRFM